MSTLLTHQLMLASITSNIGTIAKCLYRDVEGVHCSLDKMSAQEVEVECIHEVVVECVHEMEVEWVQEEEAEWVKKWVSVSIL